MTTPYYIDGSLYPDSPVPTTWDDPGTRADYVARVCSAWDFGIVPEPKTLHYLSEWRDIFDAYPLPHSIAYHAFRAWYHWPPVRPGDWLVEVPDQDAREGRSDPCAHLV